MKHIESIKSWAGQLPGAKWLCAAVKGLALVGLMAGVTACNDDFIERAYVEAQDPSRAETVNENTGQGLVLQEDGTYRATCRIPLVGKGRIIDNMMNSLVTVGSTETHAENVVDLDLTNTAIPQADAIGANVAYNSIISVRDINYVYSKGQKAGFVVKNGQNGLLTLDVLDAYSICTYLRGEKQEEKAVMKSTSVLNLAVGNINVNDDATHVPYAIEAEFSKPFDEVRLATGGVNAQVANVGLEIYYAYVGENPIYKAVNDGNEFFNNKCTGKFDGVNNKFLVDANLTNGPGVAIINDGTFEVDFGRDIDAGSEIGFFVTSGALLKLDVAPTFTVQSLDENGNKIEEMTTAAILGLDLASGGEYVYSLTISKPCHGAKLIITGLINLGVTACQYAFVRPPVEPDVTSYFTLANAIVYTPNYHFPSVSEGTVTYTLVQGPDGSTATIDNSLDILKGMNIPGNYRVTGTWTAPNGKEYTQSCIITRKVRSSTDCNVKLVNEDPDNAEYEAVVPESWGVLKIPIGNHKEGMDNVVDADASNYFSFDKGLSVELIGDVGVVGVRKKTGNISNGAPMRVGFVINNESDAVKADVLKFFRIRLMKGDVEVGKKVADGSVQVSLIKTLSSPLTRVSMVVDDGSIEFDRIELLAAKGLDIEIATSLKVYYAFVDYDIDKSCPDPAQECMQLITNASYNAMASFDVLGLATVGTTVTNLGNIVDGSLESYATVARPVEAGTAVRITTRFDAIPAGSPVGYVLLTDFDLIQVIKVVQLEVYTEGNDGPDASPAYSSASGGAVNVTIGNDKFKYLFVTPSEELGKITRVDLVLGQGVDLAQGMNICGVFTQPDLDGNGRYDCLDDDASIDIRNVIFHTPHLCGGELPVLEVNGGEDGKTYMMYLSASEDKQFSCEVQISEEGYIEPVKAAEEAYYTFFEDPANAGEYALGIDDNGLRNWGTLCIHATKTTWTGASDADWTNWDNWDHGMPWECTDVVVPTPAKLKALSGIARYPVLEGNNGRCQNIHFEAGAMMKGQAYLSYTGKAWVDMAIESGDYRLVSVPLQSMVTGDMFVNPDWKLDGRFDADGKWSTYDKYFSALTVNTYPEKRVNPIIYQRFWDEKVTIRTLSRGKSELIMDPNFTDWTRAFNAVSTGYTMGQGFAMRAGGDGDTGNYVLNFPKSHLEYSYYDLIGHPVGDRESIDRDSYIGRLWPVRPMTLTRETAGSVFLFGNPFMCPISIDKFCEANSAISEVHTYAGKAYKLCSEVGKTTINPMEAVFIIVNGDSKDFTVNFTDEVFTIN